jgi:hypothetical protein
MQLEMPKFCYESTINPGVLLIKGSLPIFMCRLMVRGWLPVLSMVVICKGCLYTKLGEEEKSLPELGFIKCVINSWKFLLMGVQGLLFVGSLLTSRWVPIEHMCTCTMPNRYQFLQGKHVVNRLLDTFQKLPDLMTDTVLAPLTGPEKQKQVSLISLNLNLQSL